MQRRVALALALAVLVGLAGCTGEVTDETGTETAGEQALQSTSTTVSNFSYPAGASPSGIKSVEALLDEHEAALDGTSVTLVGNKTFAVAAGSESGDDGFSYTVAHDPAADATLTVLDAGEGTLTAYGDGETQYYRLQNESGATYGTAGSAEQLRDGGPNSYTGRELLAGILGAGEYEATEVVARNGTELVRYELSSLSSTPGDSLDTGAIQSATASVYVDADGLVHDANMSLTTGEGLSFTYDADVHFEDVGSTTVDEPEWIEQAG